MTNHLNRFDRRPALPVVLAGMLSAVLAAPAHGALCLWSGLGDDTRFENQLNWSPDPVPGSADRAVFEVAGAFDVTFDSNEESVDLLIMDGAVSFRTDPASVARNFYALSGDVFVDHATLGIRGFDLLVGNHLFVDDGAELTVGFDAGFGRGHVDLGNALIVGAVDAGTLTLEDGGTLLTNHAFLAEWPGSVATVRIDGIGSTWITGSDTQLGDYGDGALEIRNGGLAVFGGALGVANQETALGTVLVEGPDSALYVWEDLTVGRHGGGAVFVTDGGDLTTGNADIGAMSGQGSVHVVGPDSRWSGGIDTRIGRAGEGTLVLANGATIEMQHVRVGDEAGSNGAVMALGTGTEWGLLDALWIGRQGAGGLSIMNGALVTSTYGAVGREAGGVGDVSVFGTGARLEIEQSLALGGASFAQGGTGTLTLHGDGEVTVGSTLRIWPDGTFLMDGGTLTATHIDHSLLGTFIFTGGTLHTELFEGNLWNDGGVVAPGRSIGQSQLDGTGALSPDWHTGQTVVDGWFAQTGGVLEFELLGPQARLNDRLIVKDSAWIDGSLVVRLLAGYVPEPTDEFVLLETDLLGGSFDNAATTARISGDGTFDVTYDRTPGAARIVLTNYTPPATCPQDIDNDGRITAHDLTLLFAAWGACDDCTFDFDDDGMIGMRDLSLMLGAWGNCP